MTMNKSKKVSWQSVAKLCDTIADLVKFQTDTSVTYTPDHVIGLARGGLVPATILSNNLGVRTVISHGYHSYDDETQTRDYRNPHGVMYQDGIIDLRKGLTGRNILIVDDLCDYGITMAGLVDRLKSKFHHGILEVRTAVLFCKRRSTYQPDYVGEYVDNDWISFPWEKAES